MLEKASPDASARVLDAAEATAVGRSPNEMESMDLSFVMKSGRNTPYSITNISM